MIKYLLMFFALSLSTFAKSEIKLTAASADGDKAELTFGVDANATYGLDDNLGEIMTIESPPPSPYYIFALANFYDSTYKFQVWTQKDYIPIPNGEQIQHTHNFKLWLDGGRKFVLNWELNGVNIDSAKIQDEMNGQFINIDLMKGNSFRWDNENVPSLNLKLIVWYNSSINSVEKIEEFQIYPNPANASIIIDKEFEEGKIVDITGKIVKVFKNKIVNTSDLKSGKYFVILNSKNLQNRSSFVIE